MGAIAGDAPAEFTATPVEFETEEASNSVVT